MVVATIEVKYRNNYSKTLFGRVRYFVSERRVDTENRKDNKNIRRIKLVNINKLNVEKLKMYKWKESKVTYFYFKKTLGLTLLN